MISNAEYIKAKELVRLYEIQEWQRKQSLLGILTQDINRYLKENDLYYLLDFQLSINYYQNNIILSFTHLEDEYLTGNEPYFKVINEIGKKYDVDIQFPSYYFFK